MTETSSLISRLSSDITKRAPLRQPGFFAVRLMAVLILYGTVTQYFLKLRPDLVLQLTRPLFATEIALLVLLLLTSALAAVLAMYPDAYQKPKLLKLPYPVFVALLILIVSQLFLPQDARMVMPKPGAHGMECAICIASVAIVPSAIFFALLRKGASIHQYQSGSFSVLAASAIGCLTLRLAEQNDSLLHVASWHYLPTVLFALFGAFLGKHLLKW